MENPHKQELLTKNITRTKNKENLWK